MKVTQKDNLTQVKTTPEEDKIIETAINIAINKIPKKKRGNLERLKEILYWQFLGVLCREGSGAVITTAESMKYNEGGTKNVSK